MSHEEEFSDFSPSGEEAAEASFHFFINDLNHYVKAAKWGPRIAETIDEETFSILLNQLVMRAGGYSPMGEWVNILKQVMEKIEEAK